MSDEKYVGTCFDTIHTNFKFDICINFDNEFLELAMVPSWHGIR